MGPVCPHKSSRYSFGHAATSQSDICAIVLNSKSINMADKVAPTESDSDLPATSPIPENLSSKKKSLPSRSRRRKSSFSTSYSTQSELYDDSYDEDLLPAIEDFSLLKRPLAPGVRYYNYEGFQNRMRTDGDFGIEVFVAKPDWYDEMLAEEDKRDTPFPPPPPPQPISSRRSRHRSSRRRIQPEQSQIPRMPPPPPPIISQAVPPSTGLPPPREYVPPLPRRAPQIVRPEFMDKRVHGHKHAYASQLKLSSGSEVAPQGRIMRIRLRSNAVLGALASVAGYDGIATENVVEFHRPFRVLEESLAGMKSKLYEMEKSMEEPNPAENVSSAGSNVPAKYATSQVGQDLELHSDTVLHPSPLGPAESNIVATEVSGGEFHQEKTTWPTSGNQDLEYMRCFVDFVQRVVLPIREGFRGVQLQKQSRICFEDIPYLFQPGSLAFLTHEARSKRLSHRSAVQKVWRMVSCCPAAVPSVYRNKTSTMDLSEFTRWSLYSFDYDGEKLVPIWVVVKFKRFTGEQDVTSLECYPLSLHENMKNILEEQKICGELFKKCISSSTKHHYYSGWNFITGLFAEPLQDHEGEEVKFPEHIESEIVIDFEETLQSYPGWETLSTSPHSFGSLWDTAPYAEFALRIWEDGPTTFPTQRLSLDINTKIVIEENGPYETEAMEWCVQDPFLDRNASWQDWTWSDEDIALLPRRVFGYVLRERKFARLDVRSIEFNTKQGNLTLDQIQMKPERRRMIRSAVAAHFRGKQGPSTSDLDPVRGKGKGLVILLHGAPGVGKTATAEAVAAETERPLFPITCGDLGFSPAAVERALKDIFRYAHLWNCILLFDEADVFLTQRERGGGNLERNALVGVFLRVLEYYSGILFLTTNRVGALDEGFRSRVHLSLCYPNLSLADTIKILEANLKRLPRSEYAQDGVARDGFLDVKDKGIIKFVSAQYEEYSKTTGRNRGPWNGRQIRNAVQIAAGLALYDKQVEVEEDGEDNRPAILKARHFQDVADTTSEFEEYLKIVKIGDDDEQAKRRQERADHWRARETYDEDESEREIRRRAQTARYRDSSVDPEFSSSRARRNPRPQRSEVLDRTQPADRRRQDDMGGGRGAGREQQRPRGSRMTRPAQDDYHEDDDDMEDNNLRDHYDEEEEQDEYTYERRSQGGRTGAGRQRL